MEVARRTADKAKKLATKRAAEEAKYAVDKAKRAAYKARRAANMAERQAVEAKKAGDYTKRAADKAEKQAADKTKKAAEEAKKAAKKAEEQAAIEAKKAADEAKKATDEAEEQAAKETKKAAEEAEEQATEATTTVAGKAKKRKRGKETDMMRKRYKRARKQHESTNSLEKFDEKFPDKNAYHMNHYLVSQANGTGLRANAIQRDPKAQPPPSTAATTNPANHAKAPTQVPNQGRTRPAPAPDQQLPAWAETKETDERPPPSTASPPSQSEDTRATTGRTVRWQLPTNRAPRTASTRALTQASRRLQDSARRWSAPGRNVRFQTATIRSVAVHHIDCKKNSDDSYSCAADCISKSRDKSR